MLLVFCISLVVFHNVSVSFQAAGQSCGRPGRLGSQRPWRDGEKAPGEQQAAAEPEWPASPETFRTDAHATRQGAQPRLSHATLQPLMDKSDVN